MKKYTKEELYKMDAVEVYKLVLKGNVVKTFPAGFWQQADAKENAAKCTRYLIEEILKYNEDDIKKNLTSKLLRDNKLSGMLLKCFKNSPYQALNNAYPNKFKEWELKIVPMGYWNNKENAIKATKWLVEEKLKLSDEEIKKQFSQKLFIENGLGGMLAICFNYSPYEAINKVYPNKFKEWEFNYVPMGYWENKENGIKATKWLIEEKLKLSDDEVRKKISAKLFIENGLSGMLQYCFKNSAYKAINSVYPNKFKEWELENVPRCYWQNKENTVKAVKWLIEEKLKLSDDEVRKKLSAKLFENNGLGGMLQRSFDGSPYKAINNAYPNKFRKNDFKTYKKIIEIEISAK
ncbi:MAG: DUF4046 domain-containing protein [Romboutsia sp.]|nr:DUF4046 domain-containing protein [Romboutsia sp.]